MAKAIQRRRRRTGPKPFRQGDLDGLCGVYSVVNAVRLLSPELDTNGAEWLFDILMQTLDDAVAHPTASVAGGVGLRAVMRLLKEAIAEMAAEYDIVLKARRLRVAVRRSKSICCVWGELTVVLSPTCVAIVGLYGRRSHWTVAMSASATRLRLFDSARMRSLRRGDCTVGKTSERVGLSVPSIVLIERQV